VTNDEVGKDMVRENSCISPMKWALKASIRDALSDLDRGVVPGEGAAVPAGRPCCLVASGGDGQAGDQKLGQQARDSRQTATVEYLGRAVAPAERCSLPVSAAPFQARPTVLLYRKTAAGRIGWRPACLGAVQHRALNARSALPYRAKPSFGQD
jgi:hypothetical protein